MDNNFKKAINQIYISSRNFGLKNTRCLTSLFQRSWWRLTVLFVFIVLSKTINAQPLPPASPSGNPVPVDGFVSLLIIAGV